MSPTMSQSHALLNAAPVPSQGPTIADEQQSNLLEDAELALESLSLRELHLIGETEELFKRQVDYVRRIDQLKSQAPSMKEIEAHTKRIASLVDSSAMLVEEVCGKVKRIDLAKSRLEDCLLKVIDILDIRACRNGVLQAMEQNNYEEAAMHIKRYLSIDQDELRKTLQIIYGDNGHERSSYKQLFPLTTSSGIDSKDETDDEQRFLNPEFVDIALAELDEVRGKLVILSRGEMARAIKEDNVNEIKRFLKIFPMLGEHEFGLSKYAEYLASKIVTSEVDKIFTSKHTNPPDKLAALFESIAKLIDTNQPLIETYYGPGHLIVVIRVVQHECDRLSRKILEEFRDGTKLQYVAKIVRSSILQATATSSSGSRPGQVQQPVPVNYEPPKLDPREVDKILNEVTLIISRSEVYLNFIAQRIKDDLVTKAESEAQRQASLLELYNVICLECELNHLVQEVGGVYVMLEQYYLNESCKKAIVMDQIDIESSESAKKAILLDQSDADPSHCFISSMLDDIFFIVKKCTKRAISTKSIEVFCAIINHCVAQLEANFCQILEERLKNQYIYSNAFSAKNLDFSQAYNAIQTSARYLLNQDSNKLEITKAQYFSALNNMDKACDYVCSLRTTLEGDIGKLRPSLLMMEQKQEKQLEKAITCLNELSQLTGRFSSVANSSLYQLFNASLRSRIRTELRTILTDNPGLTGLVTSNSDELTCLAKSLLTSMDPSLMKLLTDDNFTKLVNISRDFIAASLKTSSRG